MAFVASCNPGLCGLLLETKQVYEAPFTYASGLLFLAEATTLFWICSATVTYIGVHKGFVILNSAATIEEIAEDDGRTIVVT